MTPFDPRTIATHTFPLGSDNEFFRMLNGFSHAIIPNVAFAPVPFFNRAFLLTQEISHTVALCGLEFYYHYEENIAYPRRAIWIRVLNQNNCNVWLCIRQSSNGNKRVEIYSENKLGCIDMGVLPNGYGVPALVDGIVTRAFVPEGWRNLPFHEVEDINWQELIDKMRQLLPCACSGNCIPIN